MAPIYPIFEHWNENVNSSQSILLPIPGLIDTEHHELKCSNDHYQLTVHFFLQIVYTTSAEIYILKDYSIRQMYDISNNSFTKTKTLRIHASSQYISFISKVSK